MCKSCFVFNTLNIHYKVAWLFANASLFTHVVHVVLSVLFCRPISSVVVWVKIAKSADAEGTHVAHLIFNKHILSGKLT